MDKEKLQKRLELLKKQREQLLANISAYNGAIEECKYWLKEIELSDK
jgi:hypothetical protein